MMKLKKCICVCINSRGFNIGQRLIDEFLAKEGKMCSNSKEMAETIAKVNFDNYKSEWIRHVFRH